MRKPDPFFKRFKRKTLRLIATDLQKQTYELRFRVSELERKNEELWTRLEAAQKLSLLLVEHHEKGDLGEMMQGDFGKVFRAIMPLPLR